ncbi:MAG: MlaD family protein [Bdellovibrionota bacterium]
MLGIYLLVTIFAQFSPNFFWAAPTASEPIEVNVSFDELNGVRVGTTVVADGHVVGTVSKIDFKGEGNAKVKPYDVAVKITPQFGLGFHQGTVALQASLMSVSRVHPEPVVELLYPPGESSALLASGGRIKGYSSLEQFWSSGPRS